MALHQCLRPEQGHSLHVFANTHSHVARARAVTEASHVWRARWVLPKPRKENGATSVLAPRTGAQFARVCKHTLTCGEAGGDGDLARLTGTVGAAESCGQENGATSALAPRTGANMEQLVGH